MATLIDSEPGIAYAVAKGVATQSPAAERDPLLDITFDCRGYDLEGNYGKGIGFAWATASGSSGGIDYEATATAYASASATAIEGNVITDATAIAYAIAKGDVYLIPIGSSQVMWSKIGYLDFTLDKTNEAGHRYMPWNGWVYQIKKLGKDLIIYCQNGIAVMTPSGLNWSLRKMLTVGLKSKNSVCGTEDSHYFIDRRGFLHKLSTGGHEVIDYSNYFNDLASNTVMSYNAKLDAVHITDGTLGFIFSASGLGKGPVNITGIGYKDGTFYIVAPEAIKTDPLRITTDILDFGSRDEKTISEVDCGTALTNDIYVSVDYRWSKAKDFHATPWVKADRFGTAYVMASGIEFRINLKLNIYESVTLDYIRVKVKSGDLKIMGNA